MQAIVMKFSMPGQLRGPECRRVIPQATSIRKMLEPWFAKITDNRLDAVTIVLRVNGTLGSFGEAGVEKIEFNNREATCELIIDDQEWADRSEAEINLHLRQGVSVAIQQVLDSFAIPYDVRELERYISTK